MKNMDFVFFHGYDSVIWRGYEKCGLLDRFSGVRFCQSLMLPDCQKFNALAAKGGELHSLITACLGISTGFRAEHISKNIRMI